MTLSWEFLMKHREDNLMNYNRMAMQLRILNLLSDEKIKSIKTMRLPLQRTLPANTF